MFFRQALASIFHLFAIFLFFAEGCFALALYFSEKIRMEVIEKLFGESEVCWMAGSVLLGVGVLQGLGFYALHRGKYVRVRGNVEVDVGVVEKAVEKCLREKFGEKVMLVGVGVARRRRIEVEVEIERGLEGECKREVGAVLREKLGLFHPFYLTIRK